MLPHSAPGHDIPCPAIEPDREMSLHQTTASSADSQNAALANRSFAVAHARRPAHSNWAVPSRRPIWESRIPGCNDPEMYSMRDGKARDDPGARRFFGV